MTLNTDLTAALTAKTSPAAPAAPQETESPPWTHLSTALIASHDLIINAMNLSAADREELRHKVHELILAQA